MRGLLLVVLLVALFVGVSRMLAARGRGTTAAPSRRDALVKDPVCQTYVVLSRAVTARNGDDVAYVCSRECAARFAAGERRR